MRDDIKITKTGMVEIVSSGYDDRFAMFRSHLVIRKNGVSYRIDNPGAEVQAVLEIAGIDYATATEDQIDAAIDAVVRCDFEPIARYEKDGMKSTVETSAERIDAGIKAATGYRRLNEAGVSRNKAIAETLTEEEWAAVQCGLERINRKHKNTGRPVVDFKI